MKGTIVAGGNETPIELFTKAPNKRISISNGQSYTAFDGTSGWMGNSGRPAREMSAAESEAAGLDAEFSLALRLKEIFPQLRETKIEYVWGGTLDFAFDMMPHIGKMDGIYYSVGYAGAVPKP